MLVPLTRNKFEQVVPLLATGAQYAYYWGKFPDFLKRLMISVLGVVLFFLINVFFGDAADPFEPLLFFFGIIAGLYWLWAPVYWATIRNAATRRFLYAGFWRGKVLDLFVSEEIIGEEESVNNRGQLVITENRERRLNIEVGDESGFSTQLQVPLRRTHKLIRRGQLVEMVLMSNRSDLSSIIKVSDIFIPDLNLWVSEYPYLQRDIFAEISRKLQDRGDDYYPQERSAKPKRRRGKGKN